jgi:hypothetical protein
VVELKSVTEGDRLDADSGERAAAMGLTDRADDA